MRSGNGVVSADVVHPGGIGNSSADSPPTRASLPTRTARTRISPAHIARKMFDSFREECVSYRIIPRGTALCFVVGFATLVKDVEVLIGNEHGLAPAVYDLERMAADFSVLNKWLLFPSLFHVFGVGGGGGETWVLEAVARVGVVLSMWTLLALGWMIDGGTTNPKNGSGVSPSSSEEEIDGVVDAPGTTSFIKAEKNHSLLHQLGKRLRFLFTWTLLSPRFLFGTLWFFYLSFGIFWGLWLWLPPDNFICEASFALAAFPPWESKIGKFVCRWLVFRIVFGFGKVHFLGWPLAQQQGVPGSAHVVDNLGAASSLLGFDQADWFLRDILPAQPLATVFAWLVHAVSSEVHEAGIVERWTWRAAYAFYFFSEIIAPWGILVGGHLYDDEAEAQHQRRLESSWSGNPRRERRWSVVGSFCKSVWRCGWRKLFVWLCAWSIALLMLGIALFGRYVWFNFLTWIFVLPMSFLPRECWAENDEVGADVRKNEEKSESDRNKSGEIEMSSSIDASSSADAGRVPAAPDSKSESAVPPSRSSIPVPVTRTTKSPPARQQPRAKPYTTTTTTRVLFALYMVLSFLLHIPAQWCSPGLFYWDTFSAFGEQSSVHNVALTVLRAASSWRVVHSYGVFPPLRLPSVRAVYEVSADGKQWEAIDYWSRPTSGYDRPPLPDFGLLPTTRLDHLEYWEGAEILQVGVFLVFRICAVRWDGHRNVIDFERGVMVVLLRGSSSSSRDVDIRSYTLQIQY